MAPRALLPSETWPDTFAHDTQVCERAQTRCKPEEQGLTCSTNIESRRSVYVG